MYLFTALLPVFRFPYLENQINNLFSENNFAVVPGRIWVAYQDKVHKRAILPIQQIERNLILYFDYILFFRNLDTHQAECSNCVSKY